ncbi:MAG: hypothetical protein ACOZNI_19350 [Myxococcota bacterium]
MTEEEATSVVGSLARLEADAARACAQLLDTVDKPDAWLRLKHFHDQLARTARVLEETTLARGAEPPTWDLRGALLVVGASLWGSAGTRASLAAMRFVAEVALNRAEAALADPGLPQDVRAPLLELRDAHRRQIRYLGRVLAIRHRRAYS